MSITNRIKKQPIVDIEQYLLKNIPEMWIDYLLNLEIESKLIEIIDYENWIATLNSIPKIGDDDYDKYLETQWEYGSVERLGDTIVIEGVVTPLLIDLLNGQNFKRIEEIFGLFENIAKDQITTELGLLEITLCESLLDNYCKYFEALSPFIKMYPNLVILFRRTVNRWGLAGKFNQLLLE